jgi:hypothetical protein
VSVNDKPKCDAEQKRAETIDVMLRGVKAICETVDSLSRRMDAFEESKTKSCCNK